MFPLHRVVPRISSLVFKKNGHSSMEKILLAKWDTSSKREFHSLFSGKYGPETNLVRRSFHPKTKFSLGIQVVQGSASRLEERPLFPGSTDVMPYPVFAHCAYRAESLLAVFPKSAILTGTFSYLSGKFHPKDIIDLVDIEKHQAISGKDAYKVYFLSLTTNEKIARNFLLSDGNGGIATDKIISEYSLKGPACFVDVRATLVASTPEDKLETVGHSEDELVAANIPFHQLSGVMIYYQDEDPVLVSNPFYLPDIPEKLTKLSESIQERQAYLIYYFCQDSFPEGLSEKKMTKDILEELTALYGCYYADLPEKNPLMLSVSKFVKQHRNYVKAMLHLEHPEITPHRDLELGELTEKFSQFLGIPKESAFLEGLKRVPASEHPFLRSDNERFDFPKHRR